MKQPIRMSLLENAYDFLNESLKKTIEAKDDPIAWKFAVVNVVQAIELLLKARLQAEHPVLIYQSVDKPTKTVSMSEAVSRITAAARIDLTQREQRSIRKAQQWRDAIVHFEFEMSSYEVESVYVQLFEFVVRFHDDHTDFGVLHETIRPDLWAREAELFEFFRREFVIYNGVQVIRSWPTKIVQAQEQPNIELHGRTYECLPYGREPGFEQIAGELHPCHDCAVRPGQLHVGECDVAGLSALFRPVAHVRLSLARGAARRRTRIA